MPSPLLAFGSRRRFRLDRTAPNAASHVPHGRPVPLSSLRAGAAGIVERVQPDAASRADRLMALGVTPGARVSVLQTFPAIVFVCDQTELAVERAVGELILVKLQEG